MFRPLLPLLFTVLSCCAWCRSTTWMAPATFDDEVDAIVAEVVRDRDDADLELLLELSDIGSRDAAEGLLEIYDQMGSIYMKREVLLVLPDFDTSPEAGQIALQRLMDVATSDGPRELREAAIDSLGRCFRLGKSYLAMIVESTAMDDVREQAMERHIELAEAEDFDWYRKTYEAPVRPKPTEEELEAKRKKGRKGEDEAPPERKKYNLQTLRKMAFEQIASRLTDDEILAALSDKNPAIRRVALSQLEERGHEQLEDKAQGVFDYIEENPRNRALAAAILARKRGPGVVEDFIDLGQKFATPDFLRIGLADLLAEMKDEDIDKRVARLVGKGKPYEKTFALHAARYNQQKNVGKNIRKALGDKEKRVVLAAIEMVVSREDLESVPELEKVANKAKEPGVVSAAVDAISTLLGPDPEWEEKLERWLTHENALVRNAALFQYASRRGIDALPVLLENLQHENWSTRKAAVQALTELREPEVIGPIIEQMQHETGRMLHEFADALFLLTGQPFRTRQVAWRGWWEGNADAFEIIDEEGLAERQAEEEARRLKQVTGVEFFGVRIVSKRVIFIVDVSGSMAFDTRPEFENERPEPRLDVAKRELLKCIDGLEEGALFNILIFSGDVSAWLDDGVVGGSGESREEAKEWINRLGAFGGTNLYDAIELAFEDPDVDTIYLLSDGEPSVGSVVDPYLIRDEVKRMNEHRGIVINSIAVGESLQVLRWLAEDSGGSYVQFQ